MLSIEQLTTKHTHRFRTIRLASLKDSPEAFKSTYFEMMLLPDEVWKQQLANLATFVAVENHQDVGVIRCAEDRENPNAAHLYSLWVSVDYRGLGVAEELIGAVLKWARAKGLEKVILNVVESNRPAISLYRKVGFGFTGGSKLISGRQDLKELQMALDFD
ncbi:MAG: N-acetyltransferase [Cyclobacteriaceae bacterium]|nr:MAG: N-acetyltransferase [Cyclobacteriaceae bacterium]